MFYFLFWLVFFSYCLVPVAINFVVSGAHTKCPSLQ
jgi:hypothetical protein